MSSMTRKLLLALVVLPILLILGLVVHLKLSDLSGWRGTVARLASERIGRELTISGRFEADVGGITRLVVEDVELANPDWSTEGVMARADRLEISFDLWSLVAGPPRIREAHIRGARLRLEKDAGGRGNWQFPAAGDKPRGTGEDRGPPGLVVEVFTLEDAELGDELWGARATLDLARTERLRRAWPFLRDRRTDTYDEMLGSKAAPGWY